MYLEGFEKIGDEVGKPVVSIPFKAYIPIPTGIEGMANLVQEHIS